ncbi:DNA polymerase III subunit gamma/tau [Bifidobacterium gallicum]|nr:DNA polymerase III subunit gamma/tau [Bifidobacterium gallicum DSM 20093 = LMG 11596]
MALALYRRYRPDTFEGVVGQDQVTVPLMRALDANKLTHAYLFSGPRGCGKTSSARILARCINCAQGPTSHPCGECESCKDLANGGPGSIDVVEIDAASHNGVEDARELRDRAGFAPARDRYKIFILDEAHMVTPQGFNALLKIVEEPPEHVMFIFATTEPERVIGTIRSRTHHYPFRLVPQEIMGPYLEQICEQEHIEAEPGVLRLAMRAGGGSVRDTLSVLDQLMVGAVDGEMTYDSAVALLGFTPDVLISEAVDAVINRDGAALYGVIQKVIVGGFDARRFVEDLLAYARDLLVLTLAGDKAESVLSDDAAENREDLHRQAQALGLPAITAMAETINQALVQMVGAVSPRMRLELLAARLLATREPGALQSGAAMREGDADVETHHKAPAPHGGFIGAGRKEMQPAATTAQTASATTQSASAPAQTPSGSPAATSQRQASQAAAAPADAYASAATHAAAADAAATDAWGVAMPVMPATSAAASPSSPSSPAASADGSASAHASGTAADASQASTSAAMSGTPDERWDALVASLPEQIRMYVDRTHVPRINLAADPRTGAQRLWIKFDTPLSKYAFAFAVANESIGGSNRVQDIVRAKVHEVFGDQVSLAPTQKMANGEVAPPVSRLTDEQRKTIKAQIMQRDLKAVGAEWSQGRTSHGATQGSAAADHGEATNDTASDGDPAAAAAFATPIAAQTAVSPASASTSASASAPVTQPSTDPWGNPMPMTAAAVLHPQIDLSDPWAQPIGQSLAAPVSFDSATQASSTPADATRVPTHGAAARQAASEAQGSGTAAPVDPSRPVPTDSEDPWAASQMLHSQHGQHGQAANTRGFGTAAATDIPQGDPYGPQGAVPPAQQPEAGQGSAHTAQAQPAVPEVSAEDDVYSLDDDSLEGSGVVDIEEIKRMFEVKSEEHFAADDPHNPHNSHTQRS